MEVPCQARLWRSASSLKTLWNILWKAFMIFFAWSVLSLKRLCQCQFRFFWTLPHSAFLFSLKHVWVIWRSTECHLCAQQLLLKGSGAQWRGSLGLLSFSFVATLSDHTWGELFRATRPLDLSGPTVVTIMLQWKTFVYYAALVHLSYLLVCLYRCARSFIR